ncbi:MAG: hypothetical protein RI894_2393 [Bacteroidota bacterium]|jgi:predicted ATPase
MYIKQLDIENIRAISNLKIRFEQPAGWHVLIGDNGQGKTSVLRAVVFVVFNAGKLANTFRFDWANWAKKDKIQASIRLEIETNTENKVSCWAIIDNTKHTLGTMTSNPYFNSRREKKENNLDFFSMSFGASRRFFGKSDEIHEVKKVGLDGDDLAAHYPLFNDDVVFDSPINKLHLLHTKRLEDDANSKFILENLILFLTHTNLLPSGGKFKKINSDGIFFTNEEGITVALQDMSSGYVSVLCIVLTILMRMVETNTPQEVFANFEDNDYTIPIKGFILIDEIDAHLHPEWQTRIGEWFTQYFPNIQFIVTTHNPLICRACNKGSIWQLKDGAAYQITGVAKERLVKGNILDAYGTELFGKNTVRSEVSNALLSRLGRLNIQYALGKITAEEEQERSQLKTIFQTDAPTGL